MLLSWDHLISFIPINLLFTRGSSLFFSAHWLHVENKGGTTRSALAVRLPAASTQQSASFIRHLVVSATLVPCACFIEQFFL
jgi:hypothetical protein